MIGAISLFGKDKKIFLVNFLLLQEFILSKEREKIQPECLRVKVDPKEPTEDSIMFLRKCQRKDFQQLLIR